MNGNSKTGLCFRSTGWTLVMENWCGVPIESIWPGVERPARQTSFSLLSYPAYKEVSVTPEESYLRVGRSRDVLGNALIEATDGDPDGNSEEDSWALMLSIMKLGADVNFSASPRGDTALMHARSVAKAAILLRHGAVI